MNILCNKTFKISFTTKEMLLSKILLSKTAERFVCVCMLIRFASCLTAIFFITVKPRWISLFLHTMRLLQLFQVLYFDIIELCWYLNLWCSTKLDCVWPYWLRILLCSASAELLPSNIFYNTYLTNRYVVFTSVWHLN